MILMEQLMATKGASITWSPIFTREHYLY